MGRSHATNPIKSTSDTQEKGLHPGLAEHAHEDVPSGHAVAAEAEHTEGAEEFKTIQPSILKNIQLENRGASGRSRKIQGEVQMRGQRLMHPKASLSFLLGLIAMGCVIFPIVVSGLGAAVIVGLLVLLVVSALLAQKLSRIALEDIYMARSRYAGKALATAALIMSILALVALLGILIIALLGVAFLSLI